MTNRLFNHSIALHAVHSIYTIAESAGGPSRTVTGLCASLADQDARVTLVAGYRGQSDEPLVRPENRQVRLDLVPAQRLFSSARIYPTFGACVQKYAKQSLGHTVVHDHGLWLQSNWATWRAAQCCGVPYLLSPRGTLEPWALKYKSGKKKLVWALYQRRIIETSTALVATAEQERDSIRELFPHIPVAVIPNGVPLPAEAPDRSARHGASKRRQVLFMSRVHPKKNLLGLVRAWKIMLAQSGGSDWALRIAGPDELNHTQEVRQLVKQLQLDGQIEFVGSVSEDNKHAILAETDLFVLPSFSENFGVVVAEALAHGLPVIATHGTPWAELAPRGCGWWVGSKDETLADALLQATRLADEERIRMGQIGRRYAHEAFSWQGVAQATLRLYDWALNPRSTPPDFLSR